MAKKQDAKKGNKTSGEKALGRKASTKGKAGKGLSKTAKLDDLLSAPKSSKAKDAVHVSSARRKSGRPAKKDSALTAITLSAKTTAKALKNKASKSKSGKDRRSSKAHLSTSDKATKALRNAKDSALGFFSDLKAPHIPAPSLPHVDIAKTAKDIGGQIMSVLNTNAGRIVAAEVLVYLAASLTKAAANTGAGKDATDTVMNAGAKIAAAAANAGAKVFDTGAQAASTGAAQASATAHTGKELAREVAHVAVAAVGGAVADAAQNALRRRGRPLGAKNGAVKTSGPSTPAVSSRPVAAARLSPIKTAGSDKAAGPARTSRPVRAASGGADAKGPAIRKPSAAKLPAAKAPAARAGAARVTALKSSTAPKTTEAGSAEPAPSAAPAAQETPGSTS